MPATMAITRKRFLGSISSILKIPDETEYACIPPIQSINYLELH